MKTYNVWQNHNEDGFVYGEDDCPVTFRHATLNIWKDGYIAYDGELDAIAYNGPCSHEGVTWDVEIPECLNKYALPVYFRGKKNGEEYIVKLSDWGRVGVCSLDEYYDAIAMVERSTYTGLGDFLRCYPEYRFVFLERNYSLNIFFGMRHHHFDVEGANKDGYQVRGFDGFSITYPAERKKELRGIFLKHAQGTTEKAFSVIGNSPEKLVGLETWRICIDGKFEIKVTWTEKLPEDTSTYHECDIHWSEPKLTKSTASLVCSTLKSPST